MSSFDLKVVIIGFYYGKFPDWMSYWLKSCEENPTIDFKIVTDIEIGDLPSNVEIIRLTMEEVKALFDRKLGFSVSLSKPYKLCDFRPLYGLLLEDYISEYDYWGHCDFDLIWGNIRKFINEYNIEKYDKFLPLGHLSLYKNTREVNTYFKLSGSECGDYINVLTSDKNYAFDETGGIYSIYQKNHLPMFTKRIFAEIKTYHKRFRLKSIDKNYKHQVFYYENGNVYRAFENKGKIEIEDFIYIHFRRRLPANKQCKWTSLDSFYITPNGFVVKKNGNVPDVEEIERLNHNPGVLLESLETIAFCLKNVARIKTKIEVELTARKM